MNLQFEKYLEMPADELLLDDYFIESTKYPTTESIEFWHQFKTRYPEKELLLKDAAAFLSALNMPAQLPAPDAEDRIWNNIMREHQMVAGNEGAGIVKMVPSRRIWMKWAAAAIVTGVIASGLWWWNGKADTHADSVAMVKVSTGFGEQRQVVLPDSSIISLNSNSSVSYKALWSDDAPREVWMDGEAIFEVVRTTGGAEAQKKSDVFEVHAGNMLIQVLGTRFNVNNRNQKSMVMLMHGKVKVQQAEKADDALVLEPGEIATLGPGDEKLVKTSGSTDEMDGWKRGLLFFDNTPLSEVIIILEQQYGVKVKVEDPSILKRTISGQTPAQNIDILLRSLSVMMGLDITNQDNQITIR